MRNFLKLALLILQFAIVTYAINTAFAFVPYSRLTMLFGDLFLLVIGFVASEVIAAINHSIPCESEE